MKSKIENKNETLNEIVITEKNNDTLVQDENINSIDEEVENHNLINKDRIRDKIAASRSQEVETESFSEPKSDVLSSNIVIIITSIK